MRNTYYNRKLIKLLYYLLHRNDSKRTYRKITRVATR